MYIYLGLIKVEQQTDPTDLQGYLLLCIICPLSVNGFVLVRIL